MKEINEKKYYVYMHRNKINNKSYIGITCKNPKKRWANGSGYQKDQPVFYNAIQKYGWENFEHIIWDENLTEKEAKDWEVRLIALFQTNCCRYKNPESGYNMTDGGDGAHGHTLSEETKEKIRISATGRKASEETKKKMSEARSGEKNHFYNKRHSEKTKMEIGNKAKRRFKDPKNHGMYGKHHSKESINKNIASQNKKPVVQLNKRGYFIAEFISINEAERNTGIKHSSISDCCHHRPHYNTAGGYFWLFKDEYDELSKILNGVEIIQYLRSKNIDTLKDILENYIKDESCLEEDDL